MARSAYSPSVYLTMHEVKIISGLCSVRVKTRPGDTCIALSVCLMHGHTVGRPSCTVSPLSRSWEGSHHMEGRHVECKDGLLSRENSLEEMEVCSPTHLLTPFIHSFNPCLLSTNCAGSVLSARETVMNEITRIWHILEMYGDGLSTRKETRRFEIVVKATPEV